MKRNEIASKQSKERVIYMDLSQLYPVKFIKNFGAFKTGDETYVSLPIAMKWTKMGVVENSAEVMAAAKTSDCEDLMKKDKKVD